MTKLAQITQSTETFIAAKTEVIRYMVAATSNETSSTGSKKGPLAKRWAAAGGTGGRNSFHRPRSNYDAARGKVRY
jgi:hypothetical protein